MSEALWQLGGWTMLHFLWIGTGVALAGGAVRFACRRAAPGVRYAASLGTLAVLAALPLGIAAWLTLCSPAMLAGRVPQAAAPTFEMNAGAPRQDGPGIQAKAPRVIDLALTEPAASDADTTAPQASARAANPSPSPSAPRPLFDPQGRGLSLATVVASLPWVWLIGAPLTFALLAAGLIGSERVRRTSTALTEGPAAAACQRLRQAMRITRRVSLAVCDGVAQPVLVGIVRPLILLPAAALSGWTPQELEMVLLHELAHVRRWDNLVNLAQRIVESALFFHPAVWLISRQVRRDREECCDAVVVSRIEQPHDYAALLVSIAAKMQARRPTALAAASAMADHPLAGRIRRILNLEDEPMWISRRTLELTLALPLLLAGLTLYAAGPAKPPATADLRQAVGGEDNPPPSKVEEGPRRRGARGGIEAAGQLPGTEGPATELNPNETADELRYPLDQEVPLPSLRAEITRLEGLVAKANKDLVDIEVFKQLALQHGRGGGEVERAVAAIIDNDPKITDFQKNLSELQKAIQQRQKATRNPKDSQLKQLAKQMEQTQQEMMQHVAASKKSAREQIAKMPNEALRAAIVEHKIRYESTMANLKKYEAELGEAKRKLTEVNKEGPRYEGGDGPTRSADVDLRKFIEGKDNPLCTSTYEIDASVRPQIEERLNWIVDTVRKDAGDAKIEFIWQWRGENHLEVIAPEAAQDSVFLEGQFGKLPAGVKLIGRVVPSRGQPLAAFPSLEEQKIADRAYKLLGWELEPLTADGLAIAKQHGFDGGLRIEGSKRWQPGSVVSEMPVYGDLLVGLHTWPVRNLKDLDEILQRNDLRELTPLKFYVVSRFLDRGNQDAWTANEGNWSLMKGRIEVDQQWLATIEGYARDRELNAKRNEADQGLAQMEAVAAEFEAMPGMELEAMPATAALEGGAAFSEDNPSPSPGRGMEGGDRTGMMRGAFGMEGGMKGGMAGMRGAAPPRYLYDGKTFNEWRSLWKNELKTERRIEAIEALAAFARAGYGREAAEAILDVAGEYDFKNLVGEHGEGKLKQRVNQLLTLGKSSRVPAPDWLPALMERLEKDPDKWRPLAAMLMYGYDATSATPYALNPATSKLLLQMARDPKYGPNADALSRLYYDSPGDPELTPLIKAALTGEDAANALAMLKKLSFKPLDIWPEQLDLLFHLDAAVRRKARTILRGTFPQSREAVAERLTAVLDDPERAKLHADAIRALGVLLRSTVNREGGGFKGWPHGEAREKLTKRFEQITREGPPELVVPALVAIGVDSVEVVDQFLAENGVNEPEEYKERIKQARDKIEAEVEQLVDPPDPASFGGGGGGGGGGMF